MTAGGAGPPGARRFGTAMARSPAAALRRALHVLARPVLRTRGNRDLAIQTYRGYASRREVLLMGRVVRQPRATGAERSGGVLRDLVGVGRRLLRHGVGGAVVEARFGASRCRVTADDRGYFTITLELDAPPPAERQWHKLDLSLADPPDGPVEAKGAFFVPPPSARFAVISDIDDTVMHTGVTNKLIMFWRLFMRSAAARTTFPGVAALYRALHAGHGGEVNPMLYVSRAPWTIYDVLEDFFHLHRIPNGPILFLRDWGVSLRTPWGRRGKGHKEALIRRMLALYEDIPIVLIGDSGQRDPEIYAAVVKENPGRILAVYIRNVSRRATRHAAIDALAREVDAAGSCMVLSPDSFAMATHAAGHGLLPESALDEILRERQAEGPADGEVAETLVVEGGHAPRSDGDAPAAPS